MKEGRNIRKIRKKVKKRLGKGQHECEKQGRWKKRKNNQMHDKRMLLALFWQGKRDSHSGRVSRARRIKENESILALGLK